MIKYDKNSANLIQHYWLAKDGLGNSSDDACCKTMKSLSERKRHEHSFISLKSFFDTWGKY